MAEARAAFEQALAIDEEIYGPDHPNVAIRSNNLGSVLQDLSDFAGARAAFERARAIYERVYGPEHSRTCTVRGHLANLDALAEAKGHSACPTRRTSQRRPSRTRRPRRHAPA